MGRAATPPGEAEVIGGPGGSGSRSLGETSQREQVAQGAALRLLPDAVVVATADQRIALLSARAERLFGSQEAALLGQPLSLLFPALAFDQLVRPDPAAPLAPSYETLARRADGSEFGAELRLGALAEGDQPLTVLVVADLGSRRRAEEELRQAQKLEAVGRLAAGIAHEINTPVQFIGDNTHFIQESLTALLELLGQYGDLREAVASGSVDSELLARIAEAEDEADLEYVAREIPHALAQTLEGVGRVAEIVRAMKDFSHPDEKEKVAVDVNRGLRSTITVARNELKYVAEVEADFGDLPPVAGCPGDLNQVFLNLLVNASHAIADTPRPEGEKGLIRIRTAREGEQVLIAISDSGTGIRPEVRSKIFDQFFTTKEIGRGTGQGLSLARAIVVEQHGGSLTFESEMGRGTTFFIRLPIEPATGPAIGQAA
jgi:PAS domain S-box-containing protein